MRNIKKLFKVAAYGLAAGGAIALAVGAAAGPTDRRPDGTALDATQELRDAGDIYDAMSVPVLEMFPASRGLFRYEKVAGGLSCVKTVTVINLFIGIAAWSDYSCSLENREPEAVYSALAVDERVAPAPGTPAKREKRVGGLVCVAAQGQAFGEPGEKFSCFPRP